MIQNIIGDIIQFKGLRWGMEIHFVKLFKLDKFMLYELTRISNIGYSENCLIHLVNDEKSTVSMAIGIKEWFAPQISEHCP